MLCITYPLNHKWALFWSNYITNRSSRIFFAILRLYRKFYFLGDRKSRENLPEQFVVISNHQSLIDIVVYLYYFLGHKVRFVAKDGLSSAPMVGKMLRSQKHCMIPRKGNMTHCMREINKFGKRANSDNKILPVIFPEGTRSHTGKLAELKDGAAYLAIKAGVPMVPVYIAGAYQIWPRTSKKPHPLDGLHRRKIRIYVGEPMNGADYDNDAHKMTEALSNWMHQQEEMHWDPEVNYEK